MLKILKKCFNKNNDNVVVKKVDGVFVRETEIIRSDDSGFTERVVFSDGSKRLQTNHSLEDLFDKCRKLEKERMKEVKDTKLKLSDQNI